MDDLEKSFEYWIGRSDADGSNVMAKDRIAFLDILKDKYIKCLVDKQNLESENNQLLETNKKLKADNDALIKINQDLTEENIRLGKDNE